jgi:hypothetical protein
MREEIRRLTARSTAACSTGLPLSRSRASRRASAMGKLKCARLGADLRNFNLNIFINLPRSCAISFDVTVWRYKPSPYFHGFFNDSMMTFDLSFMTSLRLYC